MVQYDDGVSPRRTVLIDTTPDLRHQMLRHQVGRIDGVVYTHSHADHIFGMDDLRRFNAVMGQPIDIYGEPRVLHTLRKTFSYIFDPPKGGNPSFVASLIPHAIEAGRPFPIAGRAWQPIRLLHGHLPIVGFRIGGLAYCTDVSRVPPESWAELEGTDVLVVDALRYRHHPTHFTVDQALEVVEWVRPRVACLTHMAHDIGHAELERELPDYVRVGYDGMRVQVADA